MFRGGLRYNPIEVELQDPNPVATCNGNPSSRTYVATWCSIPVHLHVLTFVKRPNPIAPLPGPNSPHPTVAAALDAPPPVQANMVTQPDMIAIATEVETALVALIAEPSPQVLPVLACAKVTCRAHISSPGDDHVTQRILAEVHVATPRVPGLVPLSQWLQERWPACQVEDAAAVAAAHRSGAVPAAGQGQAPGQGPSHGQGRSEPHGQGQGQGQGQQQRQHAQPQPGPHTAVASASKPVHAAASHAGSTGAASHAPTHTLAATGPPPPTPLPASQRHFATAPGPVPSAAAAAVPVPVPMPPLPLPPKATAAMALHGLEPAVGLTGPPPLPPALLAQRGLSPSTSHSAKSQQQPHPPAASGAVAPPPRPISSGDGSSVVDEPGAPTASLLPTAAGGIAGVAPGAVTAAAPRTRSGPLGSSGSASQVPDLGVAAGAVPAAGSRDTTGGSAQAVAEGTQPQPEPSSPRAFGTAAVSGPGGSAPTAATARPGAAAALGSGAAGFGCFGCFAGGTGHDSEGSGPVAVGPLAKEAAAGMRAVTRPAEAMQPAQAGVTVGPLAPSGRAVLPPAVSRRLLAPAAGSSIGSGTGGAPGAGGGGSGARPYGRSALPLPPPPPLQPLLPVTDALEVLICVAEVLRALHRRGLTHGAVSPKTVQLQVTPPPPDIQALLKRGTRLHGRGHRYGREQAQPQAQGQGQGQTAVAQGQGQGAAPGQTAVTADAKQQQEHAGAAAGPGLGLSPPAERPIGQKAEAECAALATANTAGQSTAAASAGLAQAPAGVVTANATGDNGNPVVQRQVSAAESVATPTAHGAASKPASGAAGAVSGGAGAPRPPALQLTPLAQGSGTASSGGRGSLGSTGGFGKQMASPFRQPMPESVADPALAAFLDSGSTETKSRQTLAQVVAALGGVPRANHRGGAAGAGGAGAAGSSAAAAGGSIGGSGRTVGSASGPSGTGSMLTALLLGSAAVKSNASASEAVMVTAALPSSILDSAAAAAAASASSARTHTGAGVLGSSEAHGARQGPASPTPPLSRPVATGRVRSVAASPDGGGGAAGSDGGGGGAAGSGETEARAEAGDAAAGAGDCGMDDKSDDKSSTQSLQLRPLVPRPPPGQSASSVATASLARPPPQPSKSPSPRGTTQSGRPAFHQSASTPLGSTPHLSSGVPPSVPDTFSQPGTSVPSQALSLPHSHATTGLSRTTATTPHETPTDGDDTIGSAGAAAVAVAAAADTAAAGAATSRSRSTRPRRLVTMLTLPALGPAVLQMLTWGRARPVGLPRDQLLWCAPELLNTGGLGWPILPLAPRRSGSGLATSGAGATGLDPLGPLDRSLGTMRSHRMGGGTHRSGRDREGGRDKGGNVQFTAGGFMSGPGPGEGSYTYGAGLNSSLGGNRRFRLAAALLMGHDPSGAASSVYGVTPSCDVYSVGLLMWHLVTGQVPFDHLTTQEVVRAKELGSLDEQLPFSPELPLAYIALARRCWSAAPVQRPAMRSVLAELRSLRCQLLGQPQPYESPSSGFGFGFGLGLGRSSSMGDFTGDSRLSFTLSLALSSRDFSGDDYALARPPLELAFGAGARSEHGGSAVSASGGSGGPPPPPSLQAALPPGLLSALTAPRTIGGGGGGAGSGAGASRRGGGGSNALIDDESDRFTDTDRFTDQAETEHSTALSSPPTAGTPSGGGGAIMRSGSGAGGSRRNLPSAASLTRSFRMMRRGGGGSHTGGRRTTGGGGGGGGAGDTQSSPAQGAGAPPGGGGSGVYTSASVTSKFHSGGVGGGRASSGVSAGLMAGFSPGGSARASDSNSTAATPPGGGGSDRSINSTTAIVAAAGGSAAHAAGISSPVTSSNAGCPGGGTMVGTLGAVPMRSVPPGGGGGGGGGAGGAGSEASGEASSAAPPQAASAGSNVRAALH
ncbi:hypothetical protein HYH02_004556 [Chlamydomonas schloesseri]|uniref:Serine-threonine/tyrosine-protein kinase catalytic domain-containing protein n=1 Tax=Chlamydomonas schloesseri TaxID=2026947 RepID=A0A835WMV3_9CHLO|nr:hypothetical protein HYH02_004556 [Chlamydomonas schloesseri]|eukprot:KAG2450718.1 hypothetical protein HYH02_004556 [Chlamydomonas schloesseri]